MDETVRMGRSGYSRIVILSVSVLLAGAFLRTRLARPSGPGGPSGSMQAGGADTLFVDDFEDGDSIGWSSADPGAWSVVTDEGDRSLYKEASSVAKSWIRIDGLLVDDFDLRLRARAAVPVGGNKANFAVKFGCTDEFNGYTMKFHEYAPENRLYREIDGAVDVIATYEDTTIAENVYYEVRIRREDASIRVWFDGRPIIDVEDGGLPAGRIGLDAPAGKAAYFDDICVVSVPNRDVTVLSPAAGEMWRRGYTVPIRWIAGDAYSSNLHIDLYEGERRLGRIAESTPNDGEAEWLLPVDQAMGTGYRLRFADALDTTLTDRMDSCFSVTAPLTVYYDDFEDGDMAGWEPLIPGTWHVVEDEGDRSLYKDGHEDAVQWARYEGYVPEDFELRVKMKSAVPVGEAKSNFAVKFGYQELGTFYYLKFHEFPPENKLYVEVNWDAWLLAEYEGPTIQENRYYDLRVLRRDENIRVEFDGQRMYHLDDTTLIGGTLALDALHNPAFFDDVEITILVDAAVMIPDTQASPGDSGFLVPVFADDVTDLGILGYSFSVVCDTSVLALTGIASEGTLSGEWSDIAWEMRSDTLAVRAGGDSYLEGRGCLLHLVCDAAGGPGDSTALELLEFRYSGGNPRAVPHHGSVKIRDAAAVSPGTRLPAAFALRQNFPNPFNPETSVRFELPRDDEIVVTVYSILGARVRTLAEGRWRAGVHDVLWDGRDESRKPVPSGMYVCSFRSGSHSGSIRMLLLR